MEIKIKSTTIKVSFWFSLAITVLLLLDKNGTLSLAFLSALLHEIGHIVAIILQKNIPETIEFTPFGLRMKYIKKELSYRKEIQAAISGPLVNLILFFIFDNEVFKDINLALAIFNLLPVGELDGGRICYSLIAKIKNPAAAKKVQRTLGTLFLCLAFFILFAEAFFGIFNYSYFLFVVYLGYLEFFNNGLLWNRN